MSVRIGVFGKELYLPVAGVAVIVAAGGLVGCSDGEFTEERDDGADEVVTTASGLSVESEEYYELRGWARVEAAADYGEGTVDPGPPEIRTTEMDAETLDQIEQVRQEFESTDQPPPGELDTWDTNEQVLQTAEEMGDGELLVLDVMLDVDDPDRAPLAGVAPDAEERQEEIERRKQHMAPYVEEINEWLVERGGELRSSGWLVPRVTVKVPVQEVANFVGHSLVERAYEPVEWAEEYDGWERAVALQREDFTAADITGKDQTAGIFENALFNLDHVGWTRCYFFYGQCYWHSRGGAYSCGATSCGETSTSTSSNTHATQVTWTLLGSIEDGQDPNFPGEYHYLQKRRSGVVPEASYRVYLPYDGSQTSAESYHTAVEDAIAEGDVGVINNSGNFCDSGWSDCCDPMVDNAGINDVLEQGLNDGLTFTDSAGNRGDDSSCTMTYPSNRSETIAAAATTSVWPYEDSERRTASSVGPVDIYSSSGWQTTPGVDLSAPGCIQGYFLGGTDDYSFLSRCGTSYAAPTVAGGLLLLKDAMEKKGWSTPGIPRRLMTNVFLFGDSFDGSATGTTDNVDHRVGYGRARFFAPESWSLTAPWHWSSGTRTIEDNQIVEIDIDGADPLSSNVEQVKVAFSWTDRYLYHAADIAISLWDVCPSSGSEELLETDFTYALRKQIQLEDDLAGRCLQLRVQGVDVPDGEKTAYFAVMYHGGDPM